MYAIAQDSAIQMLLVVDLTIMHHFVCLFIPYTNWHRCEVRGEMCQLAEGSPDCAPRGRGALWMRR